MNKARELLKVAVATYQRGEHEIAKDIFVLAMEDGSVNDVFADHKVSTESHKKAAAAAMAAGRYDEAIRHLKAIRAEDEAPDVVVELDDEADVEVEEEEAAMSPGDVVDSIPIPDLAPAQVASIVALTRQIKAGGHDDLAAKITEALGL